MPGISKNTTERLYPVNVSDTATDAVNHPAHYTAHPSGVEVYKITQEMWCPNLANTFKYMARYQHKGNPVQDILKAVKYVEFEFNRRITSSHGPLPLPHTPPLKWEARFEPFYLYVAAEPDKYLAPKLVMLWNADKNDSEAAERWLADLRQWLIALATELKKRATEPVPTIGSVEARENENVPQDIHGGRVHEFRHEMNSGEIPEWDEWQIHHRGEWGDILGFEVLKGGKVELEVEGHSRTQTFNPKDAILLRPKGKS